MSVMDIVLILIGFILIVISYYITEKVSGENGGEEAVVTELWGEKEEGTIKERVKDIVSDKSEEMIETVEDRLCHLSNEKIMEFKEYSDQVLESIKQEHKQVVFLYNMLNEKEDSTKNLLNEIDVKYASISDKLNKITEEISDNKTHNEKEKKTGQPENELKTSVAADNSTAVNKPKTNNLTSVVEKNTIQKKPEVHNVQNVKNVRDNKKSIVDEKKEKPGPDRNDKILNLWKQGKSVLEISRLLGIGQGEVKLVIDLFKGD